MRAFVGKPGKSVVRAEGKMVSYVGSRPGRAPDRKEQPFVYTYVVTVERKKEDEPEKTSKNDDKPMPPMPEPNANEPNASLADLDASYHEFRDTL